MKKTIILLLIGIQSTAYAQVEVTVRQGAKFRESFDAASEISFVLEHEVTGIVTENFDDYLKVCIQDKCGYINELWVTQTDELQAFKKNNPPKTTRNEIYAEQIKNDTKKWVDSLTKQFGKKVGEKLAAYHIWVGMTAEMVLASRGEPESINTTVGSWGRHEQWIYGSLYLYFENGKLTSYQKMGR